MRLKIALVVHGRFHAFDLARALIARGHSVTVFTNYPGWAANRFGLSQENVRSFWVHGVLTRVADYLHQAGIYQYPEHWLHPMFGRWAAIQLARQRWDVIHSWTGVSEEILAAQNIDVRLRSIMRGSAHIRLQAKLLDEETQRTGTTQDHPSQWMIAREEREYNLPNIITVLSTFAYNSFVAAGVSSNKLRLLPLGARLDAFRPSPEVINARRQRILAGEPIRILYVGAMSFQKGMWDLATVARQLSPDFQFRLVGPQPQETHDLLGSLDKVTVLPRQPQSSLPNVYAWGDVFVFPTIQDGYAQVLAQAAASGLPILTTTNCAGPDLIRNEQTGWVLPIRNPDAFVDRLLWCNAHRAELSTMVERIPTAFQPRDWKAVAKDFELICTEALNSLA